jgi:hypothetical protein
MSFGVHDSGGVCWPRLAPLDVVAKDWPPFE